MVLESTWAGMRNWDRRWQRKEYLHLVTIMVINLVTIMVISIM